jgi:hypothetical protein
VPVDVPARATVVAVGGGVTTMSSTSPVPLGDGLTEADAVGETLADALGLGEGETLGLGSRRGLGLGSPLGLGLTAAQETQNTLCFQVRSNVPAQDSV